MTINCNLTESDYKAFRRYVMFRYRKIHWYFAVLLISLLALVWFSNKPEATLTEKIAGLVGVVVAWGILMLVFAVFWKLVTRFTGGRFRGSIGPHAFEIGEDTFTESNAQGRQEVRVAGLRHVAETDSHFFVITNTGTGHIIPKRDLQSFDALYDLQKRVVGHAT
jgi:hypothetical protein